MPFITFVTLALAYVATSWAIPNVKSSSPQTYTDYFDNITLPLGGLGPIPTTVGYQNNLNYAEFIVCGDLTGLGGFVPQSGANVAVISVESTLLLTGHVSTGPVGTIVKSDAIKGFTPLSFYGICKVYSAQSDASVTETCGIAASGYDIYGKEVAGQSFNIAPAELEDSPMFYFEFSDESWTAALLQNLTFGVASASAGPDTAVFVLDNFEHIKYW